MHLIKLFTILCLTPLVATADPEMDALDLMLEVFARSAHLQATLDYRRLQQLPEARASTDPALAYDIFFDGAYQRMLRQAYAREGGDLFWVNLGPGDDVRSLEGVARVMADAPGRSKLITLDDAAFDLHSRLRREARGRQILVVDGLGALRAADGTIDWQTEAQVEIFLREFLSHGRVVIMVDRHGIFPVLAESLKALSTAFPDGLDAIDRSPCPKLLWQ